MGHKSHGNSKIMANPMIKILFYQQKREFVKNTLELLSSNHININKIIPREPHNYLINFCGIGEKLNAKSQPFYCGNALRLMRTLYSKWNSILHLHIQFVHSLSRFQTNKKCKYPLQLGFLC